MRFLKYLIPFIFITSLAIAGPVGQGPVEGGGATGGAAVGVEDDAYGAGWNGDVANAPSQNAVYDYLINFDSDADGLFTDEAWFDLDNISGTNEVGLYGLLSDVTDFTQPGEDETITANWVNTTNPWADNEVADDITASNYLPLAGGTLTGALSLTDGTDTHILDVQTETGEDASQVRLALDGDMIFALVPSGQRTTDYDFLENTYGANLFFGDADGDNWGMLGWNADDEFTIRASYGLYVLTNVRQKAGSWILYDDLSFNFGSSSDTQLSWKTDTSDDILLLYFAETDGDKLAGLLIGDATMDDATESGQAHENTFDDRLEPFVAMFADDAGGYATMGHSETDDTVYEITVNDNTTDIGLTDATVTKLSAFRDTRSQAYTAGETQTTVTEAHMLGAKYITDQGGSAETDLILSAVSYYIGCEIVDTEGNGFEICPPSGEAIYLDSTAIAANDCVDSTGAVGARARLDRQQIADGTWAYFLTTIIGIWADGNDTGD